MTGKALFTPNRQIAFGRLLQARDPLQVFAAAARGDQGMCFGTEDKSSSFIPTEVTLD